LLVDNYCMLFCSMVRVMVRLSVWLVIGYAPACVLVSIVIEWE